MLRYMKVTLYLLALIGFSALAASATRLTEKKSLGPVTVTAQKKKEDIQKIPLTVSSFSDLDLEDAGIKNTMELVRFTPNVHMKKAYGMEKRIDTMAGDYYSDPLGQGYDLILASDTLYYEPEKLDAIAAKLYHALAPGGILVGIHGVLSRQRTAPPNLVLGMLPDALTDQGELPDSGFLASPLLQAGFKSVQTRKVSMPSNEMELDIARKA